MTNILLYLVDKFQCATEISPHFIKLCLPKQRIHISGAVLPAERQKTLS